MVNFKTRKSDGRVFPTSSGADKAAVSPMIVRQRGLIKRSIADVRRANRVAGRHFFDRDSMDFFNSRIETKGNLINDKYFITSEQFVGSDGVASPRSYTVREARSDGSIDTVGDFKSFISLSAAKDKARSLK